jgi:Protein of unknown function (DUF2934)
MSKKPSPSRAFDDSRAMGQVSGISNRESAAEESAERAAHPPVDTNPPPPEDAVDRTDGQATGDLSDLQMSAKAGIRSMAQKETGSRYPDTEMPTSKKVPGAFGKEHQPDESRMHRIAKRAHEIYEARGGQHGKAMEDWLTAERQIDDEIERSLIK